jgi:hypothetical protein
MFPATWVFQYGDRLCSLQISLFSRVDERHVYLKRKQCMLEAGISSQCFPVRIELFLKEIPPEILVLHGGGRSVFSK